MQACRADGAAGACESGGRRAAYQEGKGCPWVRMHTASRRPLERQLRPAS